MKDFENLLPVEPDKGPPITRAVIFDTTDLTERQICFLNRYIDYSFNITKICLELGISRQTYYYWLVNNTRFKEVIETLDCALLDYSKEVLINSLKLGNLDAAKFVLNKLDPRFRDKVDITSGGEPITKITMEYIKRDGQGN